MFTIIVNTYLIFFFSKVILCAKLNGAELVMSDLTRQKIDLQESWDKEERFDEWAASQCFMQNYLLESDSDDESDSDNTATEQRAEEKHKELMIQQNLSDKL